jgi:hypothetical protein
MDWPAEAFILKIIRRNRRERNLTLLKLLWLQFPLVEKSLGAKFREITVSVGIGGADGS